MNTQNESLRNLINFGLGNEDWQGWVDHYAEKYDALSVDGFDFQAPKLSYSWQQLIASTGMTPLPTYVDPESEGYEVALRQIEGMTGNIPTQKQFYRLNRTILMEKLQLVQQFGQAAFNEDLQQVFMGLMDESTDGLIQSYSNALTHQRMRLVSTGQFEINAANNPRGIQGLTLKFGIPDDNFDTLKSTARWWTDAEHTTEGTKADPVGYCRSRIRFIRRKKHFLGRIVLEIAKTTAEDLCGHSKVIAAVAARLYPNAADQTVAQANVKNLDDEAILEQFRKLIGADAIRLRDSLATVVKPGKDENGDPDLVEETIENFVPTNIAFIPEGKIGDIQGVKPLTLGYNPEDVATFHDGRLVLTTRTVPKTHSIYIDSEFAQLCVPSMPKHMYISTVTA
ncbi:MAG: hypothetical protein NC311_07635 [Muribaculaceae bacterium]|nr:hypothetical protein [Muribaculaceae bacterium]